jgi:hypothetical protein
VGTILAATSVPANAMPFNLDVEYTGGDEPAGPRPWLTATFEDVETEPGELPQVKLTLDASGLTADEFVSQWYFNFDPTVSVEDSFVFGPTHVSGPDLVSAGRGWDNYDADNYDAGGSMGHGFDFFLGFETADSADRFGAGETSVFTFIDTGTGPSLSAESFNYLNEAGYFYSAAHVQGIDISDTLISSLLLEEDDDEGSGWIGAPAAIPGPSALLLIGAGLVSLFGIRRFRLRGEEAGKL